MITIHTTDSFTVGRTRVTIQVSGCVDCGATMSIGAEEAVQHMVTIGDRKRRITLKRCATCAEKRGAAWPAEQREQHRHEILLNASPARTRSTV